MRFFKTENSWVIIFLVLLSGIFSWIVFHTDSSFGGGDHYEHYKYAHFGWKYPYLLFNHWAKPVFTILISPFAQFGLNTARIYNVLAGLLTAWFTWKIAQKYHFKFAWLVTFFVVFTPIYFGTMFTALTEITFSLFLVASIYLFFRERYIFSAILISFLPMIRTEGIVLFPIFIAAFSFKQKFTLLPFMLLGFILISLIGWPFYESFWWQITEMPYTGEAKAIYGSGSLMHFVNHTPNILGAALGIMFIPGLAALIYSWLKTPGPKLNDWFYFILLIPFTFLTFFAAHSFVWWQGMGNSLGLIRVIASVSPLAALTSLYFLDFIFNKITRFRLLIIPSIIVGFMIWIGIDCINKNKYGFYKSVAENELDKAVNFIKEKQLDKHKIYYFNTYVIYPLQIDPYVDSVSHWGLDLTPQPGLSMPDSSLIIWDAHFGPNEGQTKLSTLQESKDLVQLAIFRPDEPITVLGGYNYEVYIFQKISTPNKSRQFDLDFGSLPQAVPNPDGGDGKCRFVNEKETYLSLVTLVYSSIEENLLPLSVNVTFSFFTEEPISNSEILLTCSMEKQEEVPFYEVYNLNDLVNGQKEWVNVSKTFEVPSPGSKDDLLKIYLWNKKPANYYVGKAKISFTPVY